MATTQQLTNDDTNARRDLYRYDLDDEHLELLTVAQPEATGEVKPEKVYASEDGKRVYFKATGALLTGQTPTSEGLYLADEEGLHFLTPLEFSDEIQLSDDGRRLLLSVNAALDPGDTDSNADVYLYDSETHNFTWLSTGQSGGNGPASARIETPLTKGLAFGGITDEPASAITADGSRAFFTTTESLMPADVNSSADVYEWTEGKLGLISSGTAARDVAFGGVSASGETALFSTNATLTPDDRDGGEGDIYAARLGGGFPASGGDCSCQGDAPLFDGKPVNRQTPPSATFSPKQSHRGMKILDYRWGSAKSGHGTRLVLSLDVPSPGLISAQVQSNESGKAVFARGRGGAIKPGKVTLVLRVTADGQRRLSRAQSLVGSLVVHQGDRHLERPFSLQRGRNQ
jgi:hypothetical protein